MQASGRFITSFTLVLAMASAAWLVAGCVSAAGIAPKARAADAAVLRHHESHDNAYAHVWLPAIGANLRASPNAADDIFLGSAFVFSARIAVVWLTRPARMSGLVDAGGGR
jgi:hypothetical protein